MTITLPGVAASTTPTVIKTFFRHYKTQIKKDKEDRWTEATDEILFHEAFAIVKRFIDIATTDTVESLQRFTNTQIPAQPGTTSLRALIPLNSCEDAAKLLIEYFGDDDLRNIVGGQLWWQVRGLRGVQAEWIAMKNDWNRARAVEQRLAKGDSEHDMIKMAKNVRMNKRHERKRSFVAPIRKSMDRRKSDRSVKKEGMEEQDKGKKKDDKEVLDEGKDEPEESFEELDRLKRVMYYIHGGGYYFGSLSTHRLMITRFARKYGGRAFAVNYRKAPQYPWPCAIQDILAGYLYLIRPPPEARHEAIDPKHIVVAGDSAGGGLCLALMCILRDLDLPMPAGGVLLSPWCDMTHSFPSILQNTATDIIPTYGFIHKPSTLWPLPDTSLDGEKKIAPDKGGSANQSSKEDEEQGRHENEGGADESHDAEKKNDVAGKAVEGNAAATLAEQSGQERRKDTSKSLAHLPEKEFTIMVQGEDGKEEPLKLTRQIQLYATNAQLFHPLCSPVLQGSLGGLPPLYILAGDGEVLRDEIIYLAHRAAHPEKYPLNDELLHANVKAQQCARKFNQKPTKVHLQVYDGQPHVLTLFSFTTPARYAYRAIASFVKHVTGAPTNVINPFPHLTTSGTGESEASSTPALHETTRMVTKDNEEEGRKSNKELAPLNTSIAHNPAGATHDSPQSEPVMTHDSPAPISSTDHGVNGPLEGSTDTNVEAVDAPADAKTAKAKRRRNVTLGTDNAYDGQVPLRRPTFVQEMIRERVDIRGKIRPLEEAHLLQALQMARDEIGAFKQGAVQRYLNGQTKWDERFKKQAKRVVRQRAKNEEQARQMLRQAEEEGLLADLSRFAQHAQNAKDTSKKSDEYKDGWADLVKLGPLALEGETPPPSAIAGRQDTEEAVELLRQALYMLASKADADESTVARVSQGQSMAGRRDRGKVRYRSATGAKWKQSAAERQVDSGAKYGLTAWAGAMSFFGRRKKQDKKTRQAHEAKRSAKEAKQRGKNSQGLDDGDDDDNTSWQDLNTPTNGTTTPRRPVDH